MTHIHGDINRSNYQPLDVLREGGAEHQSLTILFRWHSRCAHQAAHVRLKTHIQHPVSFIQHQVTHLTQAHLENISSKF